MISLPLEDASEVMTASYPPCLFSQPGILLLITTMCW